MPDKVQVVQQNIDSELGLSSSHIQVDKVQSPLTKAGMWTAHPPSIYLGLSLDQVRVLAATT